MDTQTSKPVNPRLDFPNKDVGEVIGVRAIPSPKGGEGSTEYAVLITTKKDDKTTVLFWPYIYSNRNEGRYVAASLCKRFKIKYQGFSYKPEVLSPDFVRDNDWVNIRRLPECETRTPYLGMVILCCGLISLLICAFLFMTQYTRPYVPYLGIVLTIVGTIMGWKIIRKELGPPNFDAIALWFLGTLVVALGPGAIAIQYYLNVNHTFFWGLPYILGLINAVGGAAIVYLGPFAVLFLICAIVYFSSIYTAIK